MKTINHTTLNFELRLISYNNYYDRDDHSETVAEEDNNIIVIGEPILY